MSNKVIFITGASTGIGFDAAKALVKEGNIVYASARSVKKMKPLEELGATIQYVDVTDQESINKAVSQIVDEQGRIDVLFSNAGYATQGPVEMVEIEDVQRQFDVNVIGNARLFKAVLPHMRKARQGKVLVTSSAAGHVTMPGQAWYPATKHALDAVVGGLRMELKDFGISVSLIEPGYTNTEFLAPATESLDELSYKVTDPIYRKQMAAMRNNFKKSIESGDDVSVITKLVLKAVEDPNPKRYYAAGQARLAKAIKRIFGYALLDRMMINTSIKYNEKRDADSLPDASTIIGVA